MLGLDEGATPAAAKARYRELLRAHHPDVAGHPSTATAATLTGAWRVLRESAAVDDTDDTDDDVEASGDTIVVPVPADEAFRVLLDAASSLGEVTYVDAGAGLLETVVTLPSGAASLVVTLQGRAATGTTEAFCTLATIGAGPDPDAAPVVADLADLVRASLRSAGHRPNE